MRKPQAGWTLIELMIVVSILAAATAAVFARATSARTNALIEGASQSVLTIAKKARDISAARTSFAWVAGNGSGIAMGLFPSNMVDPVSFAVTNEFKAPVTIAVGADPKTLDITYSSVPPRVCIELISRLWNDMDEFVVSSTNLKASSPSALQADLSNSTAACTVSNSPVSMVFRARL